MTSKATLRGPMVAPAQVVATRKAANMTQVNAAAVIGATARSWKAWEGGTRNMPPAKLQLFKLLLREETARPVIDPLHTPLQSQPEP